MPTNHQLSSRIAHQLTLRHAEAITLSAATIVTVLTWLMVGSGVATEVNPISAWLIETHGWAAFSGIRLAAYASFFLVAARVLSNTGWCRTIGYGVVSIVTTGTVLNAGHDFWQAYTWGYPVVMPDGLGLIMGVSSMTIVFFRREKIKILINSSMPSITGEQFRAIALALLMVASLPAITVAFSGGFGVIDGDHNGTALADEGDEDELGYIYTGSNDDTVKKIDPETGSVIWTFEGHSGSSNGVSVSHDGESVYSAGGDGDHSVRKIDSELGTEVWSYEESDGSVITAEESSDGGSVYVGKQSGDTDNLVKLDGSDGSLVWESDAHSDTVVSVSPHNDHVYTASFDDTVKKINGEDGSVEWSYEGHSDTVNGVSVSSSGDYVYTSSHDNTVRKIDASDGSEEWSYEGHSDTVAFAFPHATEDFVYTASYDETTRKVDGETGDEVWSTDIPGRMSFQSKAALAASDGVFYIGLDDGDYAEITDNGDSGEVTGNHQPHEPDNFVRVASQTSTTLKITDTITGTVTDQNGDPVDQATIEAYGIDFSSFEDTAEDAEQAARELEEQITNFDPPQFSESIDFSDFTDVSATYPLVHTRNNWNEGGPAVGIDLAEPSVIHDANEPLVISAWDPDESGIVSDFLSGQTRDWPGQPVNTEITITELDATGDSTETIEIQTDEEASASTFIQTINIATIDLPPGFYRIEVEESGVSYVVAVSPDGTLNGIQGMITDDIRNEQDRLTAQAERVRDRIQDGGLQRTQTTTDENGNFELELPAGADRVALQATKGPDFDLELDQSITTQIENARNAGYNGSIYASTRPKRIDGDREEPVEIQMQKFDTTPFGSIEDFQSLLANFEDQLFNESIGDLESFVDDVLEGDLGKILDNQQELIGDNQAIIEEALEEIGRSSMPSGDRIDEEEITTIIETILDEESDAISEEELQTILEQLRDDFESDGTLSEEEIAEIIEQSTEDQLTEDDIETIADSIRGNIDQRNAELEETIEALQSRINELESLDISAGDPEIEDGLLSIGFPTAFDVDEDDVAVQLKWNDGSVDEIDEEYISIEDGGMFGGNEIRVDEFPFEELADGRALADVQLRVLSGESYGESSASISNPAFQGDIPRLNGVDLTTIRPGPDETVGVTLRPQSNSGYGELVDIRVRGPDRQDINATIDGERATFRTEGPGAHRVTATFTNDDGEQFRESFRIGAQETSVRSTPTVRLTEGSQGPLALAGDAIADTDIEERSDGTVDVSAVIDGSDSIPREIHVQPDAAFRSSTDRLTFRVQRGGERESIRQHVSVVVHSERMTDRSIVYRNRGEAITREGTTRFGEIDRSDDKATIQTYTDERGELNMELNHDPSGVDRLVHWASIRSPIDLSALGLTITIPEIPQPPGVGQLSQPYTPIVGTATPGSVEFGPTEMTAIPQEVRV
ncbi:PQQ-binding-like beta-propeller repeat protein [Natronocalculus amylovorans]|uniref:PQQ-binding-like beta-propeller repeat protein n=1 Tax=Natronocalculus amylovorans TaxID=2917812 RepID=A0AAE3FZR4_9EURY|nr:PQQ-binding-like beta-propeller repeat protein [Natronocalculus amylovorans]MCL9818319.1 PQQ-binding-like beta-propeller repeat protein [Natronocalculus amylovorans]